MKITFVTVSPSAMQALGISEEKCKKYDPELSIMLFNAMDEMSYEKSMVMKSSIEEADLTFIDLMGSPPSVHLAVEEAASKAKGHIVPFGASSREHMRLGAFGGMSTKTDASPSMESMKKMQNMAEKIGNVLPGKMRDMRNYSLMMKYFQNGTQRNYDQLILLILKEYWNCKGIQLLEPEIPKPLSFYQYRDGRMYESLKEYEAVQDIQKERDALLLFFNPSTYPMDSRKAVSAMAQRFSKDFDVYAIALSRNYAEFQSDLEQLLNNLGEKVALIVNCMPFRLGAGPMGGDAQSALNLLEKVDVPYLHPFFLTRRTEEQWNEDPKGCSTGETLISVILPELDGAQETFPIATLNHDDFLTKEDNVDLKVISERLDHFAKRAKALALLRKMENKEKKLAILCYNYPPGEANLFGGAFLDTFQSIARILSLLKEEGYNTEALSVEELQKQFGQGAMVNEGFYESDYEQWIKFDSQSYESSVEVEEVWGKRPGDIMSDKGKFLIPGIQVGNIFVGLQPSRGRGKSELELYHDKTIPPHHQYMAYYQWIEKQFGAHALLHIGTHGTLEFLKGKEIGMSGSCYPDKLVGSLPHIYLYYCGNPAEAMIAKRRSHANLVSYMPPVFVEGGLHGDLLELQTEIENYYHALTVNPSGTKEILSAMKSNARTLGLSEDLGSLEEELLEYQQSLIPKGLHVFGESYSSEEQVEYEKGLERLHKNSEEENNALLLQAKGASRSEEKEGLLRALSGRYAKARLGGDIYRNPEVLPSGYNLYQFDPRLVPSRLAMKRGKEICKGTLELFQKEKKAYPESVAVILWGLETSRTQGETLGQILAYLGVEMDISTTTWNRKFRILSLEELGRPRIDVTVNICGFFRDMFGDLLETLSDLFEQIQELDEPEEMNFLKAHGRKQKEKLLEKGYTENEAEEFAKARIFGPREGEYGTSLTGLIETKDWEAEEALGFAFTASLRHAYGRRLHGKEIEGLYEANLKSVEIVSQLRSSHEYEITDLDHYYEFFGGLAKSVEMVRGEKAQMYISDTTRGKSKTETIESAINRGLRTRTLNPKWSDALLEHSYHGAQEIAQRFENVMGLAATTGAVQQQLFHDLEKCYVEDEIMSRRMEENNPHAYMDILEQMMEYYERGYWDAEEEQLERIRSTYLRLENRLEEQM